MIMPGIKRKQSLSVEHAVSKGYKKPKPAASSIAKKSKAATIDHETATDSDPIVESDTTEHSGEDDGVSWPSEDNGGDVEVASPVTSSRTSVKDMAPKVGDNAPLDGAGQCKFLETILRPS